MKLSRILFILPCLLGAAPATKPEPAPPAGIGALQDVRGQFIDIERVARMPADEQSKQLPHVYRDCSPRLMSAIVEGIVSSMPANLFARDRTFVHGGTSGYLKQLDDAAATMSPEQVADAIVSNHHAIILRVAARRRCMQLLEKHPDELKPLIDADLAGDDINAARRAFGVIHTLQLTDYTGQVATVYLDNGKFANEAQIALVWLNNPQAIAPLMRDVEANPNNLTRHAMLLSGMLRGRPAKPLLVRLLDASDPELRAAAAESLAECGDPALAANVPKLVQTNDARIRLAGARIAFSLKDEAFEKVRPALLPLLGDKVVEVRLVTACGFAAKKDSAGAETLAKFLEAEAAPPNGDWRIIQAISALAGTNYHYDIHNWGPANPTNQKAITAFRTWIAAHPSKAK